VNGDQGAMPAGDPLGDYRALHHVSPPSLSLLPPTGADGADREAAVPGLMARP